LQEAGVTVSLNRRLSQYLREPALAGALPHLHLEKPVLGGNEALREKEVVRILRVNVGNAPVVTKNFHLLVEAANLQFSIQRGNGPFRATFKIFGFLLTEEKRYKREEKDEEAQGIFHRARII
jgi:hypothetical protein